MRKTFFLLLPVLLVGCQQFTTAQTNLNTFTQADLANAITQAKAAGPAGAEIVPCLTFVQSAISALPSASTANSSVGIATLFVEGDLALGNVSNALSANSQSAYEQACGPLVLHIQNQGLTIQAQIAALAALIAKP